ncbi:MAG: class I SAM-dependent methyltransferase [Candidatus Woesearchaeota archaeon]
MYRVDVINAVLASIQGRTYLEIGVDGGFSFKRVVAPRKIAVDPNSRYVQTMRWVTSFFPNGERYFAMTSDDFFENCNGVLKPGDLDLAFIDGLHTHIQSTRDLLHCLEYLSPNGAIIMHDCNPTTEAMAYPAGSYEEAGRLGIIGWTGEWSGDVWKTIVEARTNAALEVVVLDCDCGIGIIRRGLNRETLAYTADQTRAMSYSDLEAQRTTLLNLRPLEYLHTFLRQLKGASSGAQSLGLKSLTTSIISA